MPTSSYDKPPPEEWTPTPLMSLGPEWDRRFRSMRWFERKLRLLAGSGWNGEHPTGYRWAQRLLTILERTIWRG